MHEADLLTVGHRKRLEKEINVAIAVTAVFYDHLEINLRKKFSKISNILPYL
jgi:hypothetical protein